MAANEGLRFEGNGNMPCTVDSQQCFDGTRDRCWGLPLTLRIIWVVYQAPAPIAPMTKITYVGSDDESIFMTPIFTVHFTVHPSRFTFTCLFRLLEPVCLFRFGFILF